MTVKGMSAVKGRRGTYAALARQRSLPEPTYTQEQLRDRRRQGHTVRLGGDWSLADEIAALCAPLADRAAGSGRRSPYTRYVEDVADAVADLMFVATGLLAEADAQARTRHLAIEDRERARIAIRALAQRPTLPQINSGAVDSGTWAAELEALAQLYTDQLARLLGNAATSVVSDRVLRALAQVDHAARALERRFDRDAQPRTTPTPTVSQADRARAELESLGVSL